MNVTEKQKLSYLVFFEQTNYIVTVLCVYILVN